ncbi:MAG: RecX family transcriptional regulator [Bacteroidales bacterium]|nr:RecX family transcriptional regulator [Bacteroidales bacterium]
MKEKAPRQITEEKAFALMATLCAKREYCTLDIQKKLSRYLLDDNVIDKIIDRLKAGKYIDEARYCHSFINDKLRFNKWGHKKIEFALKQKQIPLELISDAFLKFSDEMLNESLETLLRNKLKTIKSDSDKEKRSKLIRFAIGRGFLMDETLRCVEKILSGK